MTRSLFFLMLLLPALALSSEPRVISTSPQLTELLFQLGLGKMIVGTPNESRNPEPAKAIKKIGLLFQPNLELMIQQNPNWVIWDESSYQESLDKKLRSLGISTIKLSLNSPEDIFNSAFDLEKLFPSQINLDRVKKVQNTWMKTKLEHGSFSFVVLTWAEPPILCGSETFLYRLFQGIGGKGIVPKVWNEAYPKVSIEWLISHPTDFVFYLEHGNQQSDWVQEKCRQWWPNQNSKCVGISSDLFARASLTPIENLEKITKFLGGTP